MTGGGLLPVLLSVALGAAAQRITGLGFALVSSPLLVLSAGPVDGVRLANMFGALTSLIVFLQTRRDVEYGRVALIVIPAVCGVPVGAWVARTLPAALLMIVIGGLVLLGMLTVLTIRGVALFPGRLGAIAAGVISGFMTSAAGVGGPPMALYAISVRWEHRKFVASMQLFFFVLSTIAVITDGFPRVPAWWLAAIAGGLAAGVLIGHELARYVPDRAAQRAVIVLALCGAAGTLLKGIWLLR